MQKTQFWLAAKRRWKTVKSYIGWEDYIALFAILIGVVGYIQGPIPFIAGLTDFFFDQRSNLIALGLTVLIIDNVNEMYRRRAEKERLILQMGSPDNSFAIEATRQLSIKNWLFDGSLQSAYLMKANLSKAELFEADLRKANLCWANLSAAFLDSANLSEANLIGANMSAALLDNANLSGANLSGANLSGVFLNNANLNEANLSEVKYNNITTWPAGFDPVAVGCVKVQD